MSYGTIATLIIRLRICLWAHMVFQETEDGRDEPSIFFIMRIRPMRKKEQLDTTRADDSFLSGREGNDEMLDLPYTWVTNKVHRWGAEHPLTTSCSRGTTARTKNGWNNKDCNSYWMHHPRTIVSLWDTSGGPLITIEEYLAAPTSIQCTTSQSSALVGGEAANRDHGLERELRMKKLEYKKCQQHAPIYVHGSPLPKKKKKSKDRAHQPRYSHGMYGWILSLGC